MAGLAEGAVEPWQSMAECAERQAMAPLLYFELQRAGLAHAVPSEVLGTLREAFHANAACNLGMFHELGAILDALNRPGVAAIVLKGAFLAQAVYANPALRLMGDLDILVRPDDVPTAIERLSDLGYGVVAPPWINVGCDIELGAPARLAKLELHWGLTGEDDNYEIPVDLLWETARPLSISGRSALGLAPEELLIYLCYHAANKHLFMQGLRSLVDVDQTVRRYGQAVDWDRIVALSTAWRLQRGVQLTASLCHQYLGTPIEQATSAGLALEIRPEVQREALDRLSMKEEAFDVARANLFHVQAQRGLIARMQLFLKYVFRLPMRPDMRPEARTPLITAYYVLRRLAYLIGHYSGTIWHLVRAAGTGSKAGGRTHYLLPWLEA